MKRWSLLLSAIASIFVSVTNQAEARPLYRGMTTTVNISATDIADLRALGANLIRFPMVCGEACDTFTPEEYLVWLNSRLDYLESTVLPAAAERGMFVIVSLNSTPGGYVVRGAKPQLRIFTEKAYQDTFISMWPNIVSRFLTNPRIIAWDILSEPAMSRAPSAGLLDWNNLAAVTAQGIRNVEPNKKIVVTPLFSAPENFKRLKLPKIDTVMTGFNMYFPLQFTHQGLDRFSKTVIKYPSKRLQKKQVLAKLNLVTAFLRKNKGVQVHVGEFTLTRWSGVSGDRYLKDIINFFEKKNFSWSYHAWREAHPWDLELVTDKNSTAKSPTPTSRLQLMMKFFALNQ